DCYFLSFCMKVGLYAIGYYAFFLGPLYCHNITFNIALYEMMLIDFKHRPPIIVIMITIAVSLEAFKAN
ncbi:MAG: hypothetical protein ACJ703_02695, partial [Nitrososphaera sp.]